MNKSELAEVLRNCLPSKRMLEKVNYGVVKVGDELIYLKKREGAEEGDFITWKEKRGFEDGYNELLGKSVIFSLSLINERGIKAINSYLANSSRG